MKTMIRKTLALLLCLSLCLGMIPPAWAEEDQNDPYSEVGTDDITLVGDSCIGKLTARVLEQDQNHEPMPGAITDILVSGTTATVELSTSRNAKLVVAIYAEDGIQMLGSGSADIDSGAAYATVEIDVEEMPEYFVTGAYLLDADTWEPISQEYISRYYTKEFQDFLGSTISDYDENLVLNLDENDDRNYVVYSDDTVRVTEQESVNQITNTGDGSYTIHNAEEIVRSLKVGDKFSCTTMDGTVIVFRVGSVSVSGTTVTLTEDETATLEDIFEYIKIEDVSDGTDATIDTTEMDAGVSYVGEENVVLDTYESGGESLFGSNINEELDAPIFNTQVSVSEEEQTVTFNSAPARNIDQTVGTKFKFKIENEKASGEITFGVSVNFKLYKSGSWTYQSFKIDFSTKATLEILSIAEFEKEIKLGEPQVPVGASGLKASFPISFVFKANARIAITQEMKMTLGFAIDSDYGFMNLSSLPTLDGMKLDISGKVYIGFKIEAKISTFFSLAATSISGEVGFEASGKMKGWPFELGSTSKKHECDACIEGSIKAQCGFKVKLGVAGDAISKSWTIAEFEWKLADFYYSLTKQVYDWGTCPYISYRVKIHVLNSDASNPANTPVDGAMVLIQYANSGMPAVAEDAYPITDDEGVAEIFLPSGEYKISTSTINGLRGEATITVKDFAKDVNLWIDDGLIASGKWGNLDWVLDKSGLLTISGVGQMNHFYSYSNSSSSWRYYSLKINNVIIEEGITCIGSEAFRDCSNLESVSIPTSITYVGTNAFYNCNVLKSVYINDLSAWCKTSFYHESGSYDFPSNPLWNGADLYYNGEIVRNHLDIPEDIDSIGGGAFAGYKNITSVSIPDGVTGIGEGAFTACNKLANVIISETAKPTGICCFGNNSNLTSAGPIGSGCDIEFGWEYEIPQYAFSNCASLTSVIIPEKVTRLGSFAFSNCTSFNSIVIPENIIYIDSYAFSNCSGLTNIAIPDGVKSIGRQAFSGCTGIQSITIPSSVETIGIAAFSECRSLTNVIMEEGVKSLGGDAFSNCINLTSITIPSTLTSVSGMVFNNCPNLHSIYINDIAAWCQNAYSYLLLEGGYNKYLEYNLYCNGNLITALEIPAGVTAISRHALHGCKSITSVIIPDSVSSIGTSAFNSCTSIVNVNISEGVQSIGESAFAGCTSLTTIALPESVTSIGESAFAGCDSLVSVTMKEGVTCIESEAFISCDGLSSVTIPMSVGKIGYMAFAYCNNLTDVYYSGSEDQWSTIDIDNYNDPLQNATIHYMSSVPSSNGLLLTSVERSERFDIANLEMSDTQAHGIVGAADPVMGYASLFGGKPDTLPSQNADGVIYAETIAKFSSSEMTDGSEKLARFTDLVPGASYVLLVVKDEESDDLFDASNLLYIAQLSADENGQISMVYAPRTDRTQKTALAFGESTNNLKDSTVSLEQREDGILQVTVTYGDLELADGTDYTYGIETGEETVIVSVKGCGEYAGTIKVEADKLPHTPSLPIWENDAFTPGESAVVIHCAKCGETLDRKVIHAEPDFVLPSALTTIEDDAFAGGAFIFVKLPEQDVSIGRHAFADCPNLVYVYIPALTTHIDEEAFGNKQELTILGKVGSTAETYAQAHHYTFIAVP